MAYEMSAGTGMPLIMGTGNGDGGFGGMGLGGILIGALLAGGNGLFGNRGYGAGLGGAEVAGIAGIQNQLNGITAAINAESVDSSVTALAQANQGNFNAITAALTSLATQGANANFTTLQSINGLGNQVTAQNNQNALQTLNSFNQLNTSVLQGFNEVGRDTANSFNQIIMGQNALSAQLASCCCDLKSSIVADGSATRALINDLNTQNLNTQIADLKSQVNTNAIINALRPVTPVIA